MDAPEPPVLDAEASADDEDDDGVDANVAALALETAFVD